MYRLIAALLARLRDRCEPTDVELLVERYRREHDRLRLIEDELRARGIPVE